VLSAREAANAAHFEDRSGIAVIARDRRHRT